jgi:site-specific DNA recombinase
VCFDKVDRLSRNVFDKRVALLYEKALNDEIELHFASDGQIINSKISATEKFQFNINLGLAKYYSDAISDNVKRATEQKLRKGEWPGKAPFGYRNVDLDNGKKWVVVEESEAQVVEQIFNWYATGAYSMLQLRDKANEIFHLNLSKGRIDFFLKSTFYMGVMTYDGQQYLHHYDPIISKKVFDRVQEIKAGYNKKHFKFAGLPYIYRGLIRCSNCGCLVTPEKKKGQYVYYHCTQYFGKHGAEWIREEDLTEQFTHLYNHLKLPDEVISDITDALRVTHEQKTTFHDDLLKRYQSEYDKYEKRIEGMYMDQLDGSITKDYYEEKRKEFRDKQLEISDKIQNLHHVDEDYYLASDYVLSVARRAGEIFKSSKLEEKRLLLKMSLQNLKLSGKNIEYEWVKPFDQIVNFASRQEWLRG